MYNYGSVFIHAHTYMIIPVFTYDVSKRKTGLGESIRRSEAAGLGSNITARIISTGPADDAGRGKAAPLINGFVEGKTHRKTETSMVCCRVSFKPTH